MPYKAGSFLRGKCIYAIHPIGGGRIHRIGRTHHLQGRLFKHRRMHEDDLELVHAVRTPRPQIAEWLAHRFLYDKRDHSRHGREWFRVTRPRVIQILEAAARRSRRTRNVFTALAGMRKELTP